MTKIIAHLLRGKAKEFVFGPVIFLTSDVRDFLTTTAIFQVYLLDETNGAHSNGVGFDIRSLQIGNCIT